MLEGMTDETVSALLICLMFVFAIGGAVVGMFQIEQEASYLITVTGDMFNETFTAHPEYYEWIPEAESYKEHIQTALDSAYAYSRNWSINVV